MPIHIYWGEDEFLIARAVKQLTQLVVDPQWFVCNYSQYPTDSFDRAINDILTSPIGEGKKLVFLLDYSNEVFGQLESLLPLIPSTNHLTLTCTNKPDGRNKSVKLVLSCAEVKEFPVISPWATDTLITQAHTLAKQVGVKLSGQASFLLVEAVGNNTRLMYSELEKLKTYTNGGLINEEAVTELVTNSNSNTLKLAGAIRSGDTALALAIVENLISYNEPPLKIVATLVTAFRTWLTVKVCVLEGWQNEKAIATLTEINNPKRLYFLRQEVANVPQDKLRNALAILLELELSLKSGMNETLALHTQIIQLCS